MLACDKAFLMEDRQQGAKSTQLVCACHVDHAAQQMQAIRAGQAKLHSLHMQVPHAGKCSPWMEYGGLLDTHIVLKLLW